MTDTYVQYGISIDLSLKLTNLGLPKTTLEKTSNKNLREKYGLSDNEIAIAKEAIKRKPIDTEIVSRLLENSNYTCCVCKGTKGKSYIIHHIEEYSISQDNGYHNLAVLCPVDHDLAHRNGSGLTLTLTQQQLYGAKYKWEKKVHDLNIEKASKSGNIFEIDFLNIPRILELSLELFKTIPTTGYFHELFRHSLITEDGYINEAKLKEVNSHPSTPLIFFAPYGSTMLKFHYYEIFKKILNHLNFLDLDTLLNKTSVKAGLVGEYCFYVGGLYSKSLPKEITDNSEPIKFFLKRKHFSVEWLVDPKYFCSSSAKWRTNQRNVYMIYGKIRNVNIRKIDDKNHIVIDVRPYCFGLPELRKDRKPWIAFRDQVDEIFDDYE